MAPLFNKNKPFPAASEGEENAAVTQTKIFEGRVLDRQHEDVEDQGLAFDLGTLLNRRKAIGIAGLGASALVIAACSSESDTSATTPSTTQQTSTDTGATTTEGSTETTNQSYDTEMPGETAGPYPGDGSNGQDVLEMTGVERQDITTSIDSGEPVEGVPMTVTMQIIDMVNNNQPMADAAVYLWQCDAQGNYSMYSDGYTDQTWLRGVQVTDAEGKVTFNTIVPGCYAGRWPHMHFEVFSSIADITDSENAILTSQVAIPQEVSEKVYELDTYAGSAQNLSQVSLETDNVFSDGWDMQLLPLNGSIDSGYTAEPIPVPIDTSTVPTAGAAPGGGSGGQNRNNPGSDQESRPAPPR